MGLFNGFKAARVAVLTGSAVVGVTTAVPAFAADVTWGGTYRVEAVKVANPELSSAKSNKAYLLHHLVLAPKIVAADGLTIYSRFDLFNNPNFGIDSNGTVYSVAGDTLGGGPMAPVGTTTSTNTNNSNPMSRTQRAGLIGITSLYLSWAQEFGQLVVGRTPVEFGLGTMFNAGNGLFDHFIDTKDIVGYKIVFGNISVFPMIGKVNEGNIGEEDDVNDYLLHVQYDNPETDLSLGAIYQIRTWTFAGNDLPTSGGNADIGGTPNGTGGVTPATRGDGGKSNTWGVFVKRATGDFKIGLEADVQTGDTGLRTSPAGNPVSINGMGIAGEIGWKPAEKKLSGGLKAGFASGDDPGTPETYEGFQFSRNYNVGLLMFNHPLGQRDFLRTGAIGSAPKDPTTGATTVRNSIDSEAISNAIYLAPNLQYQWKETLSVGGNVVYGILNKDPIPGAGTDKNLGFEVDLNVTYKPFDRLTWITEVGALIPGAAWKGGSLGLENSFAYAAVTKAAISF